MDNKALEKLSYFELKEKVKSYCVSGLGKELIEKLHPSSNIKQVNRMLDETSEGRRLLDASYHVPLEGVFNITFLIEKIEKGMILEASELTTIGDFLRGSRKIKAFIKDKEGYAETLASYAQNITELSYIEDEINNSIKGSRIDSNASKELKKVRRHIEICEVKIKEKLEKFIKNCDNKQFIQESFISERNGKYTIPIKASYKNIVPGTIIEVSSKGNTVFIEPNSISKYSLELTSLKVEESVEEYKILCLLTNMIFEKIRELKLNKEVIAEFDMIMAKAKYSKEIKGIKPIINSIGYVNIINGKYPLIHNSVPLNIIIGDKYRSLIITGPNAGGKTVVLKTIGLFTLAMQSGFHIAADDGTEMAVFDKVFVDIGDDQSITNALSTFSSHVKNLGDILNLCNKNSLLLFDEIGSGTEPNEGAALAIVILEEFYYKGCITIASTHYGEIKNFSQNHPHFENAAMEFKVDTLEPLYRLHIGKTGDSNALYIAQKMGISEQIIKRTKEYIENKNYNYNILSSSKITKEKEELEQNNIYQFKIGDKVKLLESNLTGIIYKEIDEKNNLIVLVDNEFIEFNYKRLKLEITAKELYPQGYDMSQLFVSYKERKLEKDIQRGSKKVLKEIRKNFKKY